MAEKAKDPVDAFLDGLSAAAFSMPGGGMEQSVHALDSSFPNDDGQDDDGQDDPYSGDS